MKPILLIGEAPAPDPSKANLHLCLALCAVGKRPTRGSPARLRAEDPGLFEFVRLTRHVNLLPFWPGYDRRGSAFPMREARAQARETILEIASATEPPDAVLLAGRRVSAAFEFHVHHRGADYFDEVEVNLPCPVFLVPHPSGVNRWWNEPENRRRARDFLVSLALEGPCS